MPSPVYADGRVYSITGGPLLVAVDAKTGKLVWRMRLQGTFYASPIVAAGFLYAFNDDGLGQIISLEGKRGNVAAERDFKDSIMGTPALSDGALYIRSAQHFGKSPTEVPPGDVRWEMGRFVRFPKAGVAAIRLAVIGSEPRSAI